jgi:branched-chain amino acid transport system substrate-binding protein
VSGRALCAAALAAAALASAGCGGDDEATKAPRGALNVYVSAAAHGPESPAGRAVAAGARLALRDAGGRAGDRRVRLVQLSANRPGDPDLDPGTVEANAKRAADDPRAIAYIGEVDHGGSAVSVPRTNQVGLLQVAPLDGLTSLTRSPQGRPRAGPERYYPGQRRTFLRLVPPDSRLATAMVELARPARGRRIALVDTPDFAPRELGAVLDAKVRRRTVPVAHEVLKDEPEAVPDAVGELARARPQVVLVSGEAGPVATALLSELARQLPDARVIASSGLAATAGEGTAATAVTALLPASAQAARGRRVLRRMRSSARPEALYGYDAMAAVLAAVRAGGGDRNAVARAALRPGARHGATGRLRVVPGGDVVRDRIALVPLDGGRPRVVSLGP